MTAKSASALDVRSCLSLHWLCILIPSIEGRECLVRLQKPPATSAIFARSIRPSTSNFSRQFRDIASFASHVLDSSIVSLRESSRLSSDLRRAAIYEEVSPCNVTALVRRQKNHGVSDLVGCPDSTERRRGGCGLLDLVDLGVA
jgi:hypothetical protein